MQMVDPATILYRRRWLWYVRSGWIHGSNHIAHPGIAALARRSLLQATVGRQGHRFSIAVHCISSGAPATCRTLPSNALVIPAPPPLPLLNLLDVVDVADGFEVDNTPASPGRDALGWASENSTQQQSSLDSQR